MAGHIIILSTTVNNPTDLQGISLIIAGFSEVTKWSVDLEDCDKILRVVCGSNIGDELVKQLGTLGIHAELLEIFNENGNSLSKDTGIRVTENL